MPGFELTGRASRTFMYMSSNQNLPTYSIALHYDYVTFKLKIITGKHFNHFTVSCGKETETHGS